jgi:hypothetical protein
MDAGREMRATSKKTRDLMRKILSEDEVRLMTRRLRKVIGLTTMECEATRTRCLGKLPSLYGIDIEDSVRFGAVATRLREAREARGMDFKTVAKAMRVPQYRLRYIEGSNMKNLRTSDLHAYVQLLGLNKWFARWCEANSKLAARLAPNSKSKRQWITKRIR